MKAKLNRIIEFDIRHIIRNYEEKIITGDSVFFGSTSVKTAKR